ncbi:DsrE family protein [Marinobacter sp. CHS3-4]|uniref:DsrE family protein n=1 Tax=Marinobacter sp. CHS3-4 TaxID=3045174 RepID=UPI0024B49A9F|nr:DsrE family protein [Marinobacter sp. CHS3-4]MDI9245462.1 DsrE family protein [Marinobacter sp. CHS3-4]
MSTPKRTLIIIDQAPYGSFEGREALDMAFSLAAFDQTVSILFSGPGVNWLRKGQLAADIHQKSVEKNLAAAPIFGVQALLANAADCELFNLTQDNLLEQVELVKLTPELTGQFNHITFAG